MLRQSSTPAPTDRSTLLASSWTFAAKLYDTELVPRFQPWTQHTLHALAQRQLPEGSIVVPCCGPGHELLLLAGRFPQHRIIGIDIAQGMIDIANSRIQQAQLSHRVEARVSDATTLSQQQGLLPVAAVYSVAGLQQFHSAAGRVLADWVNSLAPGGVAAVCYWPSGAAGAGPWLWYDQAVAAVKSITAGSRAAGGSGNWEAGIPQLAQQQGAEVVQDERIARDTHWPSLDHFWLVQTEGGPWNARKLQFGEAHMQEVHDKLFDICAAHGMRPEEPFVQELAGRLLLFQRGVSTNNSASSSRL